MSIELMLFCIQVLNRECVIDDPKTYGPEESIVYAAERYDVPVRLSLAVATVESNLNCDAKSRVGARGIMQVMPNTAEYIGYDKSRLHECHYGALVGVSYLKRQLERCEWDIDCALVSYNCGPNCRNPNNTETRNYVRKINILLEK